MIKFAFIHRVIGQLLLPVLITSLLTRLDFKIWGNKLLAAVIFIKFCRGIANIKKKVLVGYERKLE